MSSLLAVWTAILGPGVPKVNRRMRSSIPQGIDAAGRQAYRKAHIPPSRIHRVALICLGVVFSIGNLRRELLMRRLRGAVPLLAVMLLIPALAQAQASLAGVVRDNTGAVLPGVTVEATSVVLIEKARTAVTDGSGQYRITELPPGLYSLTFTLTGFSVVRRDGIEVRGSGVVPINTEL